MNKYFVKIEKQLVALNDDGNPIITVTDNCPDNHVPITAVQALRMGRRTNYRPQKLQEFHKFLKKDVVYQIFLDSPEGEYIKIDNYRKKTFKEFMQCYAVWTQLAINHSKKTVGRQIFFTASKNKLVRMPMLTAVDIARG